MTGSAATGAESSVSPAGQPAMDSVKANRFYMISLIFQRARQLQQGARPRVYKDGHKSIRLAHLEVAAGLISWELMPEPAGRQG